jgi:uncharacterized protein
MIFTPSLDGWDIGHSHDIEWVPWSPDGARAKVLAIADGFHVALVEAEAGHQGDPHVHNHVEFLYVLDGALRNQGLAMTAGDAYAASAGSSHTDFVAQTNAAYLSIVKRCQPRSVENS